MSVQVKGLANIENLFKHIENKTMYGIDLAMTYIYNQSQELVPVDTGRLKSSGIVTQIPNGYEITYHSENPKNNYNYAPIQHENLDFHHDIGQAKYLENAIDIQKIKDIVTMEVFD